MLQKEGKLIITVSVDITELDEAIKKMKELRFSPRNGEVILKL